MRNIVVIDDMDHALKQIIYEFPGVDKNNIAFRHFDTMKAFRAEKVKDIFLLFLDFFLTKDKDYGTSLIAELECEHLICFSSMKQASDHMYNEALRAGKGRIRNVYSVQKVKGSVANEQLKTVLEKILSPITQ